MNETIEMQNGAFRLPRWDELPDIELYMDQVITLMGKYFGSLSSDEQFLTSSMINNYVKNDVIPAPIKKKYSRTHLFRLIIICIMKQVLPITDIGLMINSLLKTKTEAEVLDLFAEQYEKEYLSTTKTLDAKTADNSSDSEEEALLLAVMHAATIAGVSKIYAENTLEKIRRSATGPEKASEVSAKEKKERKKSAKAAKQDSAD